MVVLSMSQTIDTSCIYVFKSFGAVNFYKKVCELFCVSALDWKAFVCHLNLSTADRSAKGDNNVQIQTNMTME